MIACIGLRILRVLHFLYLVACHGHLAFHLHYFRLVAQYSTVSCHLSFLVVCRLQVEPQVQGQSVLHAQGGPEADVEFSVGGIVQDAERAHGQFLRPVIDERHASGLGEGILYLSDTLVDGQQMRFGGVVDEPDVALLQYAVDVVVVFLQDGLDLFHAGRLLLLGLPFADG